MKKETAKMLFPEIGDLITGEVTLIGADAYPCGEDLELADLADVYPKDLPFGLTIKEDVCHYKTVALPGLIDTKTLYKRGITM